MNQDVVKFPTVFGTFSKAVPGSLSVNFTVSGGKHCDDSCPNKGKTCYAETIEKLYPSAHRSMVVREEYFSEYLQTITQQKNLAKIGKAPWVRFCVMGSIPDPKRWSENDREALRTIADATQPQYTHFPTETVDKAMALRKLGFFPRVSEGDSWSALANGFPISIKAKCDKRCIGKNKRHIAKPAFDMARNLRDQGIKAFVCPAIAGSAKCGKGSCTKCADPSVTVIIYPEH